jgi:GAF domain-containing protein
MGTLHDTRDRFHILSALVQTRTLRQFDKRLQDELLPILGCSTIGLYLYSETTAAFSPVSDIFRDPTSPAYPIAQLPAAGTIKEAAVHARQAILAKDLSNAPWTEAQAIDPRLYRRSSVLAAPVIMPDDSSLGAPGKTLAVIVAVSLEAPDSFTEEDRSFLEGVRPAYRPGPHRRVGGRRA